MENYWVYILLCANGNYYTGYTHDLKKRFQAHLAGTASKYTRSFKPQGVAQSWQVTGTKADAMRIERHIKKLTRLEKEILISHPDRLKIFFKEITN